MKVKKLIDKVNSATDCFSLYDAEKFIEEKLIKQLMMFMLTNISGITYLQMFINLKMVLLE